VSKGEQEQLHQRLKKFFGHHVRRHKEAGDLTGKMMRSSSTFPEVRSFHLKCISSSSPC